MTEQEILDNKPEGVAYVQFWDEGCNYFNEGCNKIFIFGKWAEVVNHASQGIPDLRSIADIETIVALRDEIESLKAQLEASKAEGLDSDLLVMANARRLIKAKVRTSNGRLYSELFGTGSGTGRERCRGLGLDPDSNKTSYHDVVAT